MTYDSDPPITPEVVWKPEAERLEQVLVSASDFRTCVSLINNAALLLRGNTDAAEWLATYDALES